MSRVLDGQERVGLQAIWWDNVCRLCGRWHTGGLRRSDGDSRDALCPRVARVSVEHGPGQTFRMHLEFWKDGEYTPRADDFTFDEVWGSGQVFADAEVQHAVEVERARQAAKVEKENKRRA